MANRRHVGLVLAGTAASADHVRNYPHGWFDLQEADLTSADLANAMLQVANLRGATLRSADLFEAHLADARRVPGPFLQLLLCYGDTDRPAAERLYHALWEKGVNCWLYALEGGSRRELVDRRREADRTVVLCSIDGLSIGTVIPVSLDGEWQQPQFPLTGESRDLKPLLLERGIIDLRSSAEYEAGLRRLVRRLERTRTDEEQD